MKVVINTCFGGFGLSAIALKRYAELCGRECYFFNHPRVAPGPTDYDRYEPVRIEDVDKQFGVCAFDIPNPNEVIPPRTKRWHELSLEDRQAANKLYAQHSIYGDDLARDDKNLVRVVEELGSRADGAFAKLKVVEIPDGVEWEIDEYDGQESIHEHHRVWG